MASPPYHSGMVTGRINDLRGVIYEVHNTFGETHSYVSAFGGDDVRVQGGRRSSTSRPSLTSAVNIGSR